MTDSFKKIISGIITITILGIGVIMPQTAEAKAPSVVVKDGKAYSATFVSQSEKDPIDMEAGSSKIITIKFKNSGTATWDSAGKRFITAYTMEPRDRMSLFKGNSWISAKQTGKISGIVKPGQTGTLFLDITAPEKVGTYTEKFYLSAENYSWVKGGYFYVTIKVVPKKISNFQLPISNKENTSESVGINNEYKAKLIGQTVKEVAVKGGEPVTFTALFQNTGKTAWNEYALGVNIPSGLASVSQQLTFAHELWPSPTIAVKKAQAVPAEGTIREEITFRAPSVAGIYVARFNLQANGVAVSGAVSEVSVNVTEGAAMTAPSVPAETIVPTEAPRLAGESRLRVGMQLSMDYVQFQSQFDDYRVLANGVEVVIIPKGQMAVARLENGMYVLMVGTEEFQTAEYFRFEPVNDPHAPFELLNYEKRVAWKGNPNFNAYRGAFEYRQGKTDKLMYAVNDLFMEDYVAGIAETSNLAPYEYIKALLTAARTYGYVSIGKYPFFDVLASTYDQLYLGYNSEMLMPKVAEAARDTRGKMVAYNNTIVVTPYFANSNGKTKSWNTVWGGRSEKPWLQPVQANYDVGQPMRGHGVGMSARDAAQRADKEGVDWEYLIKYYYTGVELVTMYN